jgi:hypothetical protein
MRAASSMRSRIGFSATPITVSDIRSAASHWLFSCISRPATPGNAIFAPPEKPSIRCGTIEPSPSTKSASRRSSFAVTGTPSDVSPERSRRSGSSQRCCRIGKRSRRSPGARRARAAGGA